MIKILGMVISLTNIKKRQQNLFIGGRQRKNTDKMSPTFIANIAFIPGRTKLGKVVAITYLIIGYSLLIADLNFFSNLLSLKTEYAE